MVTKYALLIIGTLVLLGGFASLLLSSDLRAHLQQRVPPVDIIYRPTMHWLCYLSFLVLAQTKVSLRVLIILFCILWKSTPHILRRLELQLNRPRETSFPHSLAGPAILRISGAMVSFAVKSDSKAFRNRFFILQQSIDWPLPSSA
jgi:hypothetical protein